MNNNLQGELAVMDSLDIKPNYAALARKYGMDWRTIKKYHNGYKGRPKTRNKRSKLDTYQAEIIDKLSIHRLSSRGVYEFFIKKYGITRMGTYSNFCKYINRHKLKPKKSSEGHPRYEKGPGEQAQVDWKEDLHLESKYGEVFIINIFHMTLKYSRYSYLELSVQKRFDDVSRCLVNGFKQFGGIPLEILFDNMSTVANIHSKPKQPTDGIKKMAKELGFKIRLCGTRRAYTKGTVEAKNKVIDWIRAYDHEFETLEDLMNTVDEINSQMNITINEESQMSPTALFYKEKEYLQPLPTKSVIDTYLTPTKYHVSNDGLIKFNGCKYSVPAQLIEEYVSVDVLDNKLYIYYNGKLAAFHPLDIKPVSYLPEHYSQLMQHKVKPSDLETIVADNLKAMDSLLESRNVRVSEIEATKSAEALIAYINQNQFGKWIINQYAHITNEDKLSFIKAVNTVLPYVADKESFIPQLKQSLKANMCRSLEFDCWVHDYMSCNSQDIILTKEGYEIIGNKYSSEIEKLLSDMIAENIQDELEYDENVKEYEIDHPVDAIAEIYPIMEEMPF